MRSIKWLGLSLTAVFLLLCGCSGLSTTANVPTPDIRILPNMGQQITPLAPQGFAVRTDEPRSARQPGLAGRASGHHRGESGSQDPAGSDQRVQPRLSTPTAPTPVARPGLERVRVHLRHFDAARRSRSKSCRSPIATTGLSSIHPARLFTWPAAPVTMSTSLRLDAAGTWAERPGTALALGHGLGIGLDGTA